MTPDSQVDPKNFKHDVNFLNNPLWIPNARAVNTGQNWVDNDGFVYSCAGSPPAKADIVFLYYLLYESQENDWATTITLPHYKILSSCGMKAGKQNKDRLQESMSRWKRVTLSFKGTFYDGKKYKIKEFSIINDWHVVDGDDKKITIEFNTSWLEKIKSSSFFKFVSFDQLKRIKSPIALRLYEILTKTFYKRSEWEIGVHKLADKIPMAETQYSHIVPKIKTAISKINDNVSDIQVELNVIKQGRNQGKFIFRKATPCEKQQISQAPSPSRSTKIPQNIINKIPEKHRVSCLSLCMEILETYGEDGLEFYIDMTNKSNPSRNYGGMLAYFFNHKTRFFEEYRAIEIESRKAKERLEEKQKEIFEQQQKEIDEQKETLLQNKKIRDHLLEMDEQELDVLDDFISEQDLNDIERSRFNKGKRDFLRIKFFYDFQNFQEGCSTGPGM